MENLYKKIEEELSSLSSGEKGEVLSRLRTEVDNIDKEIVKLINKRTFHSILIGRVKRALNLPTYSPKREKEISEKVISYNEEPLSNEALIRIYERILDESRAIQKEEAVSGNKFKFQAGGLKVNLRRILTKKEFLVVVSVFIILLSLLVYTFFFPNYYRGSTPVIFDIGRGESFTQVTERLYEKELIPSKTNFKIAAFIYGAEKQIKAARYKIPNGLSYLDLLDLLIEGKGDQLRDFSAYQGITLKGLAAKLQKDLYIDSALFIKAANNRKLIDSLGINQSSLEGYLLPNEYQFYERSTPEEIISHLHNSFKNFLVDSLLAQLKKHRLSMHKLITLASIVEGETNFKEEMPRIAGVYYNRLKIGMKLQADPTLQYIQPNGWKRLSYSDLKTDSPYNTYKYSGLPPGPINNPGKDAILAVLYPEKHNYLYFVSAGNGQHKFSKSYTEHLRYVKEYRKWWNSQKKNPS